MLTPPRRPGYELPLGKPVPPEQWQELLQERQLRRLPPATSSLTVEEVEGGFDLRYQTLDGLHRVAAQIAFDFPPGAFRFSAGFFLGLGMLGGKFQVKVRRLLGFSSITRQPSLPRCPSGALGMK